MKHTLAQQLEVKEVACYSSFSVCRVPKQAEGKVWKHIFDRLLSQGKCPDRYYPIQEQVRIHNMDCAGSEPYGACWVGDVNESWYFPLGKEVVSAP